MQIVTQQATQHGTGPLGGGELAGEQAQAQQQAEGVAGGGRGAAAAPGRGGAFWTGVDRAPVRRGRGHGEGPGEGGALAVGIDDHHVIHPRGQALLDPTEQAAGLGGKARVIEEGLNGRTTVFPDPT